MDNALLGFLRAINGLSTRVGRLTSLVLPVIVGVIVFNVVLRYGFGIGMIELEELQWHLNALVVMGCLAYAYRDDAHVRVDVLHSRLGPRGKAVIELLGGVILLMPFIIGVTWFAWQSFAYSWSLGEGSPMPSGLPARYIIKFVFFAGFALLGLQGLAAIARALLTLRGHDGARTRAEAGR